MPRNILYTIYSTNTIYYIYSYYDTLVTAVENLNPKSVCAVCTVWGVLCAHLVQAVASRLNSLCVGGLHRAKTSLQFYNNMPSAKPYNPISLKETWIQRKMAKKRQKIKKQPPMCCGLKLERNKTRERERRGGEEKRLNLRKKSGRAELC